MVFQLTPAGVTGNASRYRSLRTRLNASGRYGVLPTNVAAGSGAGSFSAISKSDWTNRSIRRCGIRREADGSAVRVVRSVDEVLGHRPTAEGNRDPVLGNQRRREYEDCRLVVPSGPETAVDAVGYVDKAVGSADQLSARYARDECFAAAL